MKPSPNSDRQSCASLGELFPKNGTAFATESPTTFVSSRPTIFGSSRRPGIARRGPTFSVKDLFRIIHKRIMTTSINLIGVRQGECDEAPPLRRFSHGLDAI